MQRTRSFSRPVVNADDYGRDRATCDAVIDGFKNGVINSASIMVMGHAFEYGVRLAKKHGLSIGLHVVLSREKTAKWRPLTEAKELCGNDGLFFNKSESIYPEYHELVTAEVRAQSDALLATGLKPAFFDSHQYGLSHFDGRFNEAIRVAQKNLRAPFIFFRQWHLMQKDIRRNAIYGGKGVTGKSVKGMTQRLAGRIADSPWLSLHVSTDKKNELYRTWMLSAVKSKEAKDALKRRVRGQDQSKSSQPRKCLAPHTESLCRHG